MNNSDFIQKRLALFLLVVFALSATPKPFFHELLAHHKDGLVCNNHDKTKPCLHQQAYHCQFDDLVVTAPYLSSSPELLLIKSSYVVQHESFSQSSLLTTAFRSLDSRGPPMM